MRDRNRSPFPGMDPYLEQSWPDVHHRLCTYSCDALRTALPSGLIPRLDERTFIEDPFDRDRIIVPDVRIVERGDADREPVYGGVAVAEPTLEFDVAVEPTTEGFIKIIDTRNEGRVITVIEFASPANKASGDGRQQYERKQKELIAGGVNLVEVDLVRSGRWNSYGPENQVPLRRRTPYHVCVTRGHRPTRPAAYLIGLRDRLPTIRIPLRQGDPDAPLDLQALIALAYLNGSYGYDVDYTRPPEPPLSEEDAAWAREVIAAAT